MRPVWLALTAVTLASAPVGAQPGPPLAQLDRNSDGAVSREEFIGGLKPLFAEIDKDRSGTIGRGEMRAFAIKKMLSGGQRPKGPPPQVPLDRNGEIRFDGFAAMMVEARFNPADLDRDGNLSRREIGLAERD